MSLSPSTLSAGHGPLEPSYQAATARLNFTQFITVPLESPFGWRTKSYSLSRQIKFYPPNTPPPLSFTTTRRSKILGYVPLLGTLIGLSRIYRGLQEYELFKNTHLHSLSKRSLKWVARGCLESVPVIGGLICLTNDITVTILHRSSFSGPTKLKDDTPCGQCHDCGYCAC